jgi:CTP:phosphocholine cytidylyltransferase-like protein
MSQRHPLHDEDEKMLKILACKKLMGLQTGCKNVYNGVDIYTDVKKYIYIYEKAGDTWLINVFGCDKETLYTLKFYHCRCCVRIHTRINDGRYNFEGYALKLFVEDCVGKFIKAETVIAFTAENGFLYSLSFIDELKCRVRQWRAIMVY